MYFQYPSICFIMFHHLLREFYFIHDYTFHTMMLLQLLLDNVEILCIYKMERSATTVEQLFLDFSMEKFNFSHHFRNAECEMWNMEYTVKAMELCSHFYVQIHMTAFKIISSFTFSPFFIPSSGLDFGTAFHATV